MPSSRTTSAASLGMDRFSLELCKRDLSESSCTHKQCGSTLEAILTGKPAKVEMSDAPVAEATCSDKCPTRGAAALAHDLVLCGRSACDLE